MLILYLSACAMELINSRIGYDTEVWYTYTFKLLPGDGGNLFVLSEIHKCQLEP